MTVDNLIPSIEADGATFFLKVNMDVTCKKKVPHGMDVMARGRCTVGEKMMVDTDGAMDVDIYDLNPGESISVHMSPFINKPLTAVPSQCEISVYLGTMPGDRKQDLGVFCFRNQTVEPKACK